MDFLYQTLEQKQKINEDKSFIENIFGFKVYGPQFDKVPFVSKNLKDPLQSILISDIEKILLTNIIISDLSEKKEFKSLELKHTKENLKRFKDIYNYSLIKQDRISITYIISLDITLKYYETLKTKNKNIESMAQEYKKLSFEEKLKLSTDIGNNSYQFLENLYIILKETE